MSTQTVSLSHCNSAWGMCKCVLVFHATPLHSTSCIMENSLFCMIIHFHRLKMCSFVYGTHKNACTETHTVTGSSLCCRPMIKVIVTLIFKGWDCFSMCAEQIVPASSCDQDFSSFWASLNYCCCWIVAHRTHLLSTCFLVVNKSKLIHN